MIPALSRYTSAELRTAEQIMRHVLDTISAARQSVKIAELRQLPCGGRCRLETWPGDGVWACPAWHAATDLSCQLPEGHTGPHIHCADSDDPALHDVFRWETAERGVA